MMNDPHKKMVGIIVNSLRLSLYRNNWGAILAEVSREMELHAMLDRDRAIDARDSYAQKMSEREPVDG